MRQLARLAHRDADREVWREVHLGAEWAEAETIACDASEVRVRVKSDRVEKETTVIAWRTA